MRKVEVDTRRGTITWRVTWIPCVTLVTSVEGGMVAGTSVVRRLTPVLTAAALVLGGAVAPATAGVAPAAATAVPSSSSATRAADVVSGQVQITLGPRRRNRLRHHYYYDPGRPAVRTMVRTIAGRWDVSPHLALAIAWQESAWQQNVRSSSGAIGIMQVLPSTGRWVDDYLVDRDLDIRRSTDNVAAGVAFLRWLLDTARLYRRSIAGYYQGLASVRRNNMFKDTRAYVRSVQALRYRSRHGGILG